MIYFKKPLVSPHNEREEDNHMKELQDLFQLYPDIDFSSGLSACGDSYEIYIEALRTYAAEPEADKLNTFFEKKDVKNYQVLVHGVKSASRSVGLTRLGEQAFALENAAKEADWDFITAHHTAFIDEYLKVIDAINRAMPATS